MIITIKGSSPDIFKDSNIGTLSTWTISRVLGDGATYNGVTYVDKNAALNATVTIAEGYELGSAGVTVTMGGETQSGVATTSEDGKTVTISIGSVTGNVVIKIPTVDESGTESGGNEDETTTYEFPLSAYGLGVTSTGTGRLTSSTTRMCNGSTSEACGILIPANHTITLYGLASGTYPLRFDYIYGTTNAVNPESGSTTAIEGLVGTASNYVSSNYFPLNIDGADIYSVTNNYGEDYYFWFAFAGLAKNEAITAEIDTYDITYTITAPPVIDDGDWLDLPVTQKALGVTSTGTGRVSTNNTARFSTADDTKANAILIPVGKTMYLKGLASGTYPLRVDYVYITNNIACPAEGSTTAIEGLVGTASNYVSSNYFPLNTAGADTLTITNNYGEDYYFYFGFAGQTLSETILNEFDTYDIKYYIA